MRTVLNEGISDGLLLKALEWLQDVANRCALAILHSTSDDVSIVREPVIRSQICNIGLGKHRSDVVVGITFIPEGSLISDISHRITDHLRTPIAAFHSRGVGLLVVLLEVDDGLHDSG